MSEVLLSQPIEYDDIPQYYDEQDPKIYGQLTIEIGNITKLKGAIKQDHTKVKVKFGTDPSFPQILRPTNASKELHGFATIIKLRIRSPLVSFHNYLNDCLELKLFVLDARNDKPIGNVIINLRKYLKRKYNALFSNE